MKELMKTVLEWLVSGNDVALSTIITKSGSTPRGAGAGMAIIEDGSMVGSLGGGAAEYAVQQMALEVIKHKASRFKSFTLSKNPKEDIGMVCGGDIMVHIQYISSLDDAVKNLFEYGLDLFSQNFDSWLVTDITNENSGHMSIFANGRCIGYPIPDDAEAAKGLFATRSVQVEIDGRTFFSKPLTTAGRTYIFGGGHIAQKLVPLLSRLGFSCFVFDNLPEFANKSLFPDADGIIAGDFENVSASVSITENDYVIIMTRSHNFDFTIELQTLGLNPRYIGAIGSRNKVANLSKRLSEHGFSSEQIDTIHMPIGLPILAQTPAEIAISVAAELIMVRAMHRESK